MKQTYYATGLLRTILVGAAVTSATLTFTACNPDAAEEVSPIEELQVTQENGAVIPGKYIVVFKEGENMRISPGATFENRIELVRAFGSEVFKSSAISNAKVNMIFGKALLGVAADLSDAEVAKLKKDPRVAYVEPDRYVSLGKPGSGGGTTAGQETPWGITRVGGAGDGAGKTAWILDSGIDLDHPDLNVDVARSMTVFTTSRDNTPDDGNGHGTHVAGTIAALNNEIGVIGVAPGATVVAVKVLDSRGSGSYSGVIAGVDYVAANGKPGDVANMSLGGPVSQALDDAVVAAAAKGIKFALAAGNESKSGTLSSPGRAGGVANDNIYTVSAMDNLDRFASFSNFGNPPIEYCAPGVNIKSTWKGGAYNTISGTSMASPHVAGLLLLGNITTSGYVKGDRDTTADPIAHR